MFLPPLNLLSRELSDGNDFGGGNRMLTNRVNTSYHCTNVLRSFLHVASRREPNSITMNCSRNGSRWIGSPRTERLDLVPSVHAEHRLRSPAVNDGVGHR